MNNIENLLEQYFEGNTSAEEEAMLRRFFTSEDIPENLAMYKPLFAYFDDEMRNNDATSKTQEITREIRPKSANKPTHKTNRKFVLWISGVAACAAILVGMFFFTPQSGKCTGEGDYVIINGRCYTDAKTIRSATLNTLREMSEEDDSDVSEEDTSAGAKQIMENQLKEFGSLFNE